MEDAASAIPGAGAVRPHIGTSGWHYAHWRGAFYPRDLPTGSWLPYYAREFQCVELNNSFYRLPGRSAIDAWVASTPEGFVFAVKASRLITHMKKLRHCGEALERFLDVISGFGPRLGPILFQLPPRWHVNLKRLSEFLVMLPNDYRYAFEFRDPSWFTEEVYDLLARYHCAFCQFELGGLTSPDRITADFGYVRLHGPGGAYAGSYSPRRLQAWARRLATWLRAGKEVFVFFDNDERGYAIQNARLLKGLCARMDDALT